MCSSIRSVDEFFIVCIQVQGSVDEFFYCGITLIIWMNVYDLDKSLQFL